MPSLHFPLRPNLAHSISYFRYQIAVDHRSFYFLSHNTVILVVFLYLCGLCTFSLCILLFFFSAICSIHLYPPITQISFFCLPFLMGTLESSSFTYFFLFLPSNARRKCREECTEEHTHTDVSTVGTADDVSLFHITTHEWILSLSLSLSPSLPHSLCLFNTNTRVRIVL